MSWVLRTIPTVPDHACQPPMREVWVTLPGMPPSSAAPRGGKSTRTRFADRPDGAWNDLWRCDDCGKLWRVGNGCDHCLGRPSGSCARGGYHPASYAWRPASWWQRLRHRRSVANGDQTTPIPRVDTDGAAR